MNEITEALKHPAFPLYLGRRSCPPAGKMVLGIVPVPLQEALLLNAENGQRIIADALPEETRGIIKDVPVSFDPSHRMYGYRRVTETVVRKTDGTEHDAFALLEE